MVEHNNEEQLDHIFHALADPTRREMVRMIAAQEMTVSELAEPFDMSLAAASKHIKVLERSGLLDRSIQGRTYLSSQSGRHEQGAGMAQFYERFWTRQFDALERELNKAKKEEH